MRILWKRLQTGLRIETWRLKVLSFSALLQSFAHEHCFDLFYIIFSWTFLEFETGTLLITLKRRVELIVNCAFPSSVLATSSRNGQCLSESRWESRFCDVICAQRYFGQFFLCSFLIWKVTNLHLTFAVCPEQDSKSL